MVLLFIKERDQIFLILMVIPAQPSAGGRKVQRRTGADNPTESHWILLELGQTFPSHKRTSFSRALGNRVSLGIDAIADSPVSLRAVSAAHSVCLGGSQLFLFGNVLNGRQIPRSKFCPLLGSSLH